MSVNKDQIIKKFISFCKSGKAHVYDEIEKYPLSWRTGAAEYALENREYVQQLMESKCCPSLSFENFLNILKGEPHVLCVGDTLQISYFDGLLKLSKTFSIEIQVEGKKCVVELDLENYQLIKITSDELRFDSVKYEYSTLNKYVVQNIRIHKN